MIQIKQDVVLLVQVGKLHPPASNYSTPIDGQPNAIASYASTKSS